MANHKNQVAHKLIPMRLVVYTILAAAFATIAGLGGAQGLAADDGVPEAAIKCTVAPGVEACALTLPG